MGINISMTAGGFNPGAGVNDGMLSRVANMISEYERDALNKAETAAYPPDPSYVGGVGGTASMGPLQTQSIQGTLNDVGFRERHLWLWRRLEKVSVAKSLIHEATLVKAKGSDAIDPFFAEGGINGFSEAEFERIVVQLKFMSENIEVPDTAAVLSGGLDGGASLLETRTKLGVKQLLGRIERWLIEGDASVSALQFNGFRSSIMGGGGLVVDLEGEAPTSEDIEDVVGELQSDGRFALDLEAFTDSRVKRVLTTLDAAAGRYPKDRGGAAVKSYIGGPQELALTTEYGDAPVYTMPLIGMPSNFPTTSVGGGAPNVGAVSGTPTVNSSVTNSRFRAGDVGEYDYRFVAVGDRGTAGAISVNGVVISAAGDAPTFVFNDSAISGTKNTSGMLRYWRVYRTEKDGTEFDYIGQFARGTAGVSNTSWTDLNHRRPFRKPIYIGEFSSEVLYFSQLMEAIRRPLGQTSASIPFMIYMMGALFFKQPQKWAIIDNCATKAA